MKKSVLYNFPIDNWKVRYNDLMGEFGVDFFHEGKIQNVIGYKKTYAGAISMAHQYIEKWKKYSPFHKHP